MYSVWVVRRGTAAARLGVARGVEVGKIQSKVALAIASPANWLSLRTSTAALI